MVAVHADGAHGEVCATAEGVDARITFDVDAHGDAVRLTPHQNGIDQRAARAPARNR